MSQMNRVRNAKRRSSILSAAVSVFEMLEERRLLSGAVPIATNDAYAALQDTTLNVPASGVLANDTDPENDTLTAVVDTQPTHGTLTLNNDGSFSYAPDAGYHGADSFTYHANDGTGDSAPATVSLTINAIPVAADDSYVTNEDTPINQAAPGVLSNDTDADPADTLTAQLVDPAQHGLVVLNTDGSFVYSPAANYNGPDSFTYRITDGLQNSTIATVTLTITAVNDAPTAAADTYRTPVGTPLTVPAAGVLSNDTDVENDALTAVIDTQPTHGTIALNADGSFTYTPDAGYSGPDAFTYHANDGAADSKVATVSVMVNSVPVAVDDAYTTAEDTALTVDVATGLVANDTDADAGTTLAASVVAQPAHGTVTVNPDGSFTYTPTANYSGADSFTYKVNDGQEDSATATVTLTVTAANDAPVATDDAYSVAVGGTLNVPAAGVLANDTDADSDPLTAVQVSGPSHGTLTLNNDGSFTYTPDAGYHGADSFTYKANDGTIDSNSATVNILVNSAPVAVDDAYTTAEDTALTVDAATGLVANDTDADAGATLTASVVAQPAHGTVTVNADGSFTYTPTANYSGADSFTYKVNDGLQDSATATVTLTVTAVNDAPVAVDDAQTTAEDTPLVIAAPGVLANDTDAENDALTAVVVAQPAHGTLTLNADGSFTYTPNANYSGTDTFTYKANDGTSDSNTATVTITVTAVNDAPVAVDDALTVSEDTTLTVNPNGVLSNDTDADADTLTAILVTGPSHGTLTLNPDGSFTYTPDANYNGADSFTYKANDGQADSNVATVTITVSAVNDLPVATDDAYHIAVGGTLNVPAAGVLSNDTDTENDALTAVVVAQPTHGTLTLNADGSFTYTPTGGFNGVDTFTYKANDGTGDSNTATVTITVNTAPVAVDDAYTTAEDTALTVDAATGLVANDTDVDAGTSLTPTIVTQPAHGTVTVNPDGSFTYTPAADYNGADSFTYKVSDGIEDSAPATVTLTITAVNDAPVAVNDAYTVAVNGTLNVPAAGVLSNDTDTENDALTAVVVAQPTHGTLTLNADGSFSYTPDGGYHGSDSFTYKANDGASDSSVATVTVLVNTAPVATDDSYVATQDTALTIAAPGLLANDTDADTDALTAVVVAQPAHGTVTLNVDGSFTYTPEAGYHGSDSFTYKANDGLADSNVATVNITVNALPVAVNDAYTVAVNGTLNVPAAGVLANDTDADANPLTAVVVSQPSHGTLTLNADGSFSYTPDAGYHGSDSFTYKANDGLADSSVATVTIAVNTAPVATADSYTTAKNTALTIAAPGLLANDTDADTDALTAVLVAQPAHGTLTLNANGSFTYTPNTGYTGADSFTYKANDGLSDSNVVTVSITVIPSNQIPVAANDTYTTNVGQTLTTTGANGVLANDSDNDNDPLTATLVANVAHGTLTFNADGSFTYVPTAGYTGPDSFTYKVSDGQANSNTATVTINVTTANQAPVAQDFSVSRAPGGPVRFNLAGHVTDANNDSLTFVIAQKPAHGQVAINPDGTAVYTPRNGYFGDDSFTYQVSDGNGGTSSGMVTVTATTAGLSPAKHDPSRKDLVVIGTSGNDKFTFKKVAGGKIKAVLNGNSLGTFNVTGRIIVHGGDGNDLIDGTNMKKSLVFYGGAGNDTLKGGLNADELYGQAGDDTIILGKTGINRILGGTGKDTIIRPNRAS